MFRSTDVKIEELPKQLEDFKQKQLKEKKEFWEKDVKNTIYKTLFNIISNKYNFQQMYLGFKLVKNYTNAVFTIEEKTVSTASKATTKKQNYVRIKNNFIPKLKSDFDSHIDKIITNTNDSSMMKTMGAKVISEIEANFETKYKNVMTGGKMNKKTRKGKSKNTGKATRRRKIH